MPPAATTKIPAPASARLRRRVRSSRDSSAGGRITPLRAQGLPVLFVIPELTAELAAERMVQQAQSTETTGELDSRLERWVAATKAKQRNSPEPSAAQITLLSNSQADAFVPHTYDLIDQLSAWSRRLDQREADLDQREYSLGRHSRFLRQCSIKQWNG